MNTVTKFMLVMIPILVSILFLSWETAFAATDETIVLTVCADGCDYSTIQKAVDAAGPNTVIQLEAGTYFENVVIENKPELTIRGVGAAHTVVDGSGSGHVIYILVLSTVTLEDLTIQNGGGGGIISDGSYPSWLPLTVTLHNCVVKDNASSGISNYGGAVVITTTLITGNEGWGIRSGAAGISYHESPYDLTYGEYYFGGELSIEHSAVTNNNNGVSAHSDQVIISTTTISGNLDSGLIAYPAPSPSSSYYPPHLVATNSTIANNSCGVRSPLLERDHTIISGNTDTDCDLQFEISSGGHNLSSDDSCNFTDPTDLENIAPLLLPLSDNGGPTPTHALAPGSPAIDAGGVACKPLDQRGVTRPVDGDRDGLANCDIGAFEFVPPEPVDLIRELKDHLASLGLHHGTENSLTAKLDTALLILADLVDSNDKAASNNIKAFLHQVKAQQGKKIPALEAQELLVSAEEVIAVLKTHW